jgi:putative flavoprotein involved in K+ transport
VHQVDTVVVGAGQAGLATSRLLVEAGRDHLVVERGRIGQRWRSERWDSLRLLTPNWMTRLPHATLHGDDPDGFMPAAELASRFERYAADFDAPVREDTPVLAVRPDGDGYTVVTGDGTWSCRNVVVASGWFAEASVPGWAANLDGAIAQVHSSRYRNPASLPDGGVLVVGASASGVQIADELRRDGRTVAIAAGSHTRLPRTYRGRDVLWWMDRLGILDDRSEDVPERARRQPSLQLVGRSGAGADLDLGTLAAAGVLVLGRLCTIDGSVAHAAGDLLAATADADRRLRRLLDRIDGHIADLVASEGLDGEVPPADPIRPVTVGPGPSSLDLRAAGIRSVVWATGHRPAFPWLDVPVLGPTGAIEQGAGVTAAPGLYTVGMRWQSRRNSTFIDGVRHDAAAVVEHIVTRRHSPVAA